MRHYHYGRASEEENMANLNQCLKACGMFLVLAMAAVASPAQTYTTLHSFDETDGSNPYAGVMQANDGNLYGTTSAGGANNDGTVFQITTSGTLTTLHNFNRFNPTDGSQPYGGLIQARDGNLYGTTYGGGGHGNVYRITLGGTMKTLHNLDYQPDGANPYAGLVQLSNGSFYGTAAEGGYGGEGTAFEVTPFGQYIPIYDFGANGGFPVAGLVQASNGNFYGTAEIGGFYGCGTLFEMTPTGTFTLLHTFDGGDGCYPQATLVEGTDGNLYGVASAGGAHNGYNAGTAFNISQSGTFTLLHVFDRTDGTSPTGALIQASDGNFYGTTQVGGAYNQGTIFKMTPSGTVTTLYSFCPQSFCNDGANPYAGLVLGSDGVFYGTTFNGGGGGHGTIFSLSVDLEPWGKISK
jgi:uncharacterized repeat protein (TIGR03803 family)